MEVFWLFSQPLQHLCFNLFVMSETFATFVDLVVNRFTLRTLPTLKRKHFFMNILCIESFCPQKKTHNRNLLFGNTLLKHGPFWLLKPASEHSHARLLPRLSWKWTVLLPSDTHRKPITSITAFLLPVVTYLLTLPRASYNWSDQMESQHLMQNSAKNMYVWSNKFRD
jgi:hypothetical protein